MKRIFFVAISCLFFSCSENKTPDGLLSRDKMIDVLIDIHLAEAAITTQQIYGETANQKAADYYDWIYREHGITHEQFSASFDYYSAHPELFKEIYSELIVKMSEQEPEIKKYIKENLQQKDSLHWVKIDSLAARNDSLNMHKIDSMQRTNRVTTPIRRSVTTFKK